MFIVDQELTLFLLKNESNSLFDLDEKPKTKSIVKPAFYTPKGELICISGYEEHTPLIRNFAQKSPENFAQVLLFSPLSANITFSDLFEAFPVLMYWLKTKKNVSIDDISDFINGLSDTSDRQLLAKAIGRQGSWKLKTIAEVWNKRKSLFDHANSLNDKNDMEGLISLLSSIPGIAPVKAGFVIQLIFGKMGCLDTHNVDMYKALSKKMGWGIENDLDPKNWADPNNKSKSVSSYVNLLKKMDHELGIGTKELWDLWVDLVGELYRKSRSEEVYSSKFGAALNPHDPKWEKVRGDVGSTFSKTTSGGRPIDLTPASGSPEGMGVSKVHQMAAIEPKELLKQMADAGGVLDDRHLFNSVIRNKNIAPLLLHYKDILTNSKKMKSQMMTGNRFTSQLKLQRQAKDIIVQRMVDNGWSKQEASRLLKTFKNVVDPEQANTAQIQKSLF